MTLCVVLCPKKCWCEDMRTHAHVYIHLSQNVFTTLLLFLSECAQTLETTAPPFLALNISELEIADCIHRVHMHH